MANEGAKMIETKDDANQPVAAITSINEAPRDRSQRPAREDEAAGAGRRARQ